jgi:hypothetical protein
MAFGAPNAGMALARTPMASPEPQIGATRPLFPPAEGFPLAAPSPATTIDTDTLAATILEKLTVSSPALQTLGTTETFTSPWAAGPASGAAPAMAGGPVQMAGETTQTTAPPPATSGPPDQIEGSTMAKPSDTDLSNLSRWLYPLIKYRLKGELREDRERAGHLTDHYRKW